MIFRMIADIEFEAEDIDDALLFLTNHFNQDIEEKPGLIGGEISIRPLEDFKLNITRIIKQ